MNIDSKTLTKYAFSCLPPDEMYDITDASRKDKELQERIRIAKSFTNGPDDYRPQFTLRNFGFFLLEHCSFWALTCSILSLSSLQVLAVIGSILGLCKALLMRRLPSGTLYEAIVTYGMLYIIAFWVGLLVIMFNPNLVANPRWMAGMLFAPIIPAVVAASRGTGYRSQIRSLGLRRFFLRSVHNAALTSLISFGMLLTGLGLTLTLPGPRAFMLVPIAFLVPIPSSLILTCTGSRQTEFTSREFRVLIAEIKGLIVLVILHIPIYLLFPTPTSIIASVYFFFGADRYAAAVLKGFVVWKNKRTRFAWYCDLIVLPAFAAASCHLTAPAVSYYWLVSLSMAVATATAFFRPYHKLNAMFARGIQSFDCVAAREFNIMGMVANLLHLTYEICFHTVRLAMSPFAS